MPDAKITTRIIPGEGVPIMSKRSEKIGTPSFNSPASKNWTEPVPDSHIQFSETFVLQFFRKPSIQGLNGIFRKSHFLF